MVRKFHAGQRSAISGVHDGGEVQDRGLGEGVDALLVAAEVGVEEAEGAIQLLQSPDEIDNIPDLEAGVGCGIGDKAIMPADGDHGGAGDGTEAEIEGGFADGG